MRYPPGSGSVTIRHLLSHSSGLANPVPIAWIHRADEPAPDPDTFLAHLLKQHAKLRFTPGSRADYSNIGFLVLGQIIAAVSGRTYEDYVRNEILAPLGMRQTDFSYHGEMTAQAATGYHQRWSLLTPLLRFMLPRGLFAAPAGRYVALHPFYVNGPAYGGLIGPVEDAARFMAMHLNGGEVEGVRILSTESARMMQAIAVQGDKLDVGLGWYCPRPARRSKHRVVEHLGGGGGFFSVMRLYPDDSLGIVLMGNATRYDHEAIIAAVATAWLEPGMV